MKKLIAIAFAFLISLPVLAAEAPDALVRRVTEDMLSALRQDKEIQAGNNRRAAEMIDAKVLPHFNFKRMTALAVGRDWRQATPEQRDRLASEFRTLLVRTYSNALVSYRNQTIDYKPFRMQPNDTEVVVRTNVLQPGGKPIELDYFFAKEGDAWKVFDVVVAGVSLVTNYRESFGQEIRANGIDGLIKSLAAKNQAGANGKAS